MMCLFLGDNFYSRYEPGMEVPQGFDVKDVDTEQKTLWFVGEKCIGEFNGDCPIDGSKQLICDVIVNEDGSYHVI